MYKIIDLYIIIHLQILIYLHTYIHYITCVYLYLCTQIFEKGGLLQHYLQFQNSVIKLKCKSIRGQLDDLQYRYKMKFCTAIKKTGQIYRNWHSRTSTTQWSVRAGKEGRRVYTQYVAVCVKDGPPPEDPLRSWEAQLVSQGTG